MYYDYTIFVFLINSYLKKIHIGIFCAKTKIAEEDKTVISGTIEKNYCKKRSKNEISQCGTNINNSDKECSTNCTITKNSHNKNNSNPPDDNMVQNNNTKSTDNIKKHDFIVPASKNLNDQNIQLQDEESSVPYDAAAVEYLDHINFENADFDDNENDYIEQFI